jgi:catechol 2,3-dioxygenase-like lactoylglutathione lyase family enzyme
MPVLTALEIADDPDRWRDLGFVVDPDGTCVVGAVAIHLRPQDGRRGVRAWSFDEVAAEEVEGIRTCRSPAPPSPGSHPNHVASIDHVVVLSPDVDRTIDAFRGGLGLEPRRERATDTYGAPMRQVFFRAGEAVVELIGGQEKTGDGRCGFFGVAFTSADLDGTKALLGDRLGDAKDAVQPGRRIATLRKTAGLTTAVAIMSPEPA